MIKSRLISATLLGLFILATQLVSAYEIPADWETFVESWLQSNPGYYKTRQHLEILKKKLSYEDRNNIIKTNIQKVFNRDLGNDTSLGTVSGIQKIINSMENNRLDNILKQDALMLIAKRIPLLGNYISTLQRVEKGFLFVEKVIENDLYKSNAYTNLVSIIMPSLNCLSRFRATEKHFPRRPDAWIPPPPFDQARAYGKAPYIPSFYIKFDPDSPQAALLESLRQHMIKWENVFFAEWSEKDPAHREAVRKLEMAPLAAQVRNVYKKVLTPRELFNRFLMRITASDQWRKIILENLHTCYLTPAAKRIAREASEKMNSTVSVALQNAVNSADAWTKRDKKPTKIFDKKSSKPHKVRQSSPQTTEKIADLIRQNKNNAAAALQEAISQGLDVNRPMPENQGEALIHVATAAGAEKILAILLSNGADVNAKDSMGETALCKAVTYDQEDSHVNLARMLLRSGANPNNRDVNGDLPLDNSSFGSNIARTIRDAGGYAKVSETGFILACQEGNVDSINDFIKAGGNVNKSFSGISALMFATANGSEASVRALLNAGAMVNVKDNNGMTALHWAAIHNQMRIAEILLQKGAKTSFKDNRGKPAGYYYYWKYGKNKNQAAKLGYPAPRNEARQRAASAKAFNEAFSALAMSMKMGLEETARQNKQRQMTPPKTASNKSGFKFTPPLTLKYQNLNLSPKSNSQKSSGQSIAVRPKIQTQASTQPQTVYWVVVERQSVGGGNLRNSARIINGGNFPSSGFSQQIGNRQWKKLTWVYGTLDANDARQYADKANQQRVSIPLTVRTAPAGNHGWVYNTDHRLPVVVLTTAANRLLRSRPGYVNPISVK